MILGLVGYARSGKDAAAAALVADGWQRRAFADALKRMLFALNPLLPSGLRVADLVEAFGWDDAKADPEVRALLQRLGTDAGRTVLGQNVWVDACLRDLPVHLNTVVTDVRFESEADAIRVRGGTLVRIVRPGVEAVNGHVSEHALDSFEPDHLLVNDGTLDQLHAAIRRIAGRDASPSPAVASPADPDQSTVE